MTDLGPVLLVLAAQITLPVTGGLLLSRRRDPAAVCAPLTLAAAAALLLVPLAFIPRPSWSSSTPTNQPTEEPVAANQSPTIAAAGEVPGGIDVLSLLRLPLPETNTEPTASLDGWQVLALVFLALGAFGIGRLFLGVLVTSRAVRAGRPTTDPDLLALANELRTALGCRQRVTLLESDRVGTAATAGWLRPTILISPAWRQWTAAERRAVLAHEIAHAVRRDFAGRLVARLAVAVHGYHPLVRWLASRLELSQEMAADARAAGSCGGRRAYMKCLAVLALKADNRRLGAAPTFLSRPRTLLRRIAMLRVTDDTPTRRRWPAVAGVLILAAAALGLHGSNPEAIAGPINRVKAEAPAERAPLDASFILPSDAPDQVGVYAVRVGALLRTPGMEKLADLYAGSVATLVGEGKKAHFKLTDVEQVSGRVAINHDPTRPPPNRSLMMSLTSIRMEKEFDWVKQLKEWSAEWKEHTYAGTKYYSAKMMVPLLGPKESDMWFYLPDARTMVLESEENIKKLIDAKGKPAAPVWADDWKAVQGGMVAVVLPDVKGKLAPKMPTDRTDDAVKEAAIKSFVAISKRAARAAIGVDLHKECSITIRLACASAADAADVDAGCQAMSKLAGTALMEDSDEPKDAISKAGKRFSMQLVNGIEFGTTVDHIVEVRMTSKDGATELFKAFAAETGEK